MGLLKFDVLLSQTHVQVGAVENLVVTRFSAAATNATLLHVKKLCLDRYQQVGKPLGSLVVVPAERHPRPEETVFNRDAFAKGMREVGTFISATAVVIEGSGFAIAAVRSAMTGITMITRLAYPLRAFGDLHDATRWIVPLVATDASTVATMVQVAEDGVARLSRLV